MKPQSYTSKRIVALFKEQGLDLPGDSEFWHIRRIYPGHNMRAYGAWSWCLVWEGDRKDYEALAYSSQAGSQWPAHALLKKGADVQLYAGVSGYELILV